jgi:uncharacterized protein
MKRNIIFRRRTNPRRHRTSAPRRGLTGSAKQADCALIDNGIFYSIFEFDALKSSANTNKHGIDFVRAQELWSDPYLIVIPAMTIDEPRHLAIGRIGEKRRSAVITYRSENIRIISVRRSRPEEVALYEG